MAQITPPPDSGPEAPDELQTEASAFAAAWIVFGVLMLLVLLLLAGVRHFFP
jgi:hypothetical protein